MKENIFTVLEILLLFCNYFGKCTYEDNLKRKRFGSFIRRNFGESNSISSLNETDKNNIVSLLFDNVEKLFGDRKRLKSTQALWDFYMNSNITTYEPFTYTKIFAKTKPVYYLPTEQTTCEKQNVSKFTVTENENQFENLTLMTEFENKLVETTSQTSYATILRNNRNIKSIPLQKKTVTKMLELNDFLRESKLSCVVCDNVNHEHCNDPKNKLITSKVCNDPNDVCYSMHTPFGIVDRGCLNINNNLSTYVCSCNLCNYIAVSEMPYIFRDKISWIDNFLKMSRSKRLRKTIFSHLDCLACEVTSDFVNDVLSIEDSHCLEGNIGHLKKEKCSDNEVCAVKAIRGKGYFWRGCLKKPLYNYWWSFCDTDLCNVDAVVSVYDSEY